MQGHVKDPSFAIKTLHQEYSLEDFKKESLALLRIVDKSHPHLVPLLTTIKHGNKWSLLFPWAHSNLLQFWKQPSASPESLSRDPKLVIWIARQFQGLASGLSVIEEPTIGDRSPDGKIWGRHVDLKPENILLFKEQNIDEIGILKISDFGLSARFQSGESETRRSPTYYAPDYHSIQEDAHVDTWSLGCIMLEFIVWFYRGWPGVDEFSKNRCSEDGFAEYQEDKFFLCDHLCPSLSLNQAVPSVHILKATVTDVGSPY